MVLCVDLIGGVGGVGRSRTGIMESAFGGFVVAVSCLAYNHKNEGCWCFKSYGSPKKTKTHEKTMGFYC